MKGLIFLRVQVYIIAMFCILFLGGWFEAD